MSSLKQYLIITGNYWAFTLTDGALRMLTVLYFHQLGFSALEIASLFLFYEFFGIVTNLTGGWLGARIGLNKTMNIGLFLQIAALSMLLVPTEMLTVLWVMSAQALSGIAKDLNKMSAKSGIKLLANQSVQGQLFRWVAILTGSKNALKGVGFFVGGLLLAMLEFEGAVATLTSMLLLVWLASLLLLKSDFGKSKSKPKFKDIVSKSKAVNILSAARMFLFGSRDVWFVVALPVYLQQVEEWSVSEVGSIMAVWIIFYGVIQAVTPKIPLSYLKSPNGMTATVLALLLLLVPLLLAIVQNQIPNPQILLLGLFLYACVFALNSSVHSYLIVHYAKEDGVSLDVGFYYMANAGGRLVGTLLSGALYQIYGLTACLWVSALFVAITTLISLGLPKDEAQVIYPNG